MTEYITIFNGRHPAILKFDFSTENTLPRFRDIHAYVHLEDRPPDIQFRFGHGSPVQPHGNDKEFSGKI